MKTLITICDTCKVESRIEKVDVRRHGEQFASLVEDAARGMKDVETRRHSCLMGCDHGCNVSIQAQGKLTYVLGRFEPDAESAAGLVAYAQKHAESETGQVAFREWPSAVKGHFIARIPLLPGDSDVG